MKVKLLSMTQDALNVLYTAARTCYNPGKPSEMWENDLHNTSATKILKLIDKIIKSGHHSPLEHINFTFAIEGITRACSHQLVRHRLCSFSQQSQRYVTYGNIETVCPDSIQADKKAYAIYEDTIDIIELAYGRLIELGIPAEDARALLPNCTTTNITMTVNLREMIHICNERLCTRAQKEIRKMVQLMTAEIVEQLPWAGEYLKPKCEKLGYCPEDKGCGRKERQNVL